MGLFEAKKECKCAKEEKKSRQEKDNGIAGLLNGLFDGDESNSLIFLILLLLFI